MNRTPDFTDLNKRISTELRRRRGLPPKLTADERRDKRREAAVAHAKRKAKRKRQRASRAANR